MSTQVKSNPVTPTGKRPYIFKLEKYKSVALEFLGDTIFLPGMDMLPIKISILFVFLSETPKAFVFIILHFDHLDESLKKEPPLQSLSMEKQLERTLQQNCAHIHYSLHAMPPPAST